MLNNLTDCEDGDGGANPGDGNPKESSPFINSPRPTEEAPPRCLRWGAGVSPQLACRLLPVSHGSSPKTEIVELEGAPSPEFPPWDR
uniref:Uncharacterized protein n=1 Tax=Colobus angolensis palliatus TaxID=336983 RepID=A0A2K5HV05_COLAP